MTLDQTNKMAISWHQAIKQGMDFDQWFIQWHGLTRQEWDAGMSVDEAEFWRRYGKQYRHKVACY